MSRPAPTIKFVVRNEEVDPVYEQQSVCNPSTGFCNTTAVLSFTPMSRSVANSQWERELRM